MDYSQFLYMKEELSLIAVIVLLLLFDLMAGEKGRKYFSLTACSLLGIHTLINLIPGGQTEMFGGMAPDEILPINRSSAARPPNVAHISSNICSLVVICLSSGKYHDNIQLFVLFEKRME